MRTNSKGVSVFLLSAPLIVFVWTVLLPILADHPHVRQRIEANHTAGINPTAVFYTDHPGMQEIELSIQSHVDSPTGSFWNIQAIGQPQP